MDLTRNQARVYLVVLKLGSGNASAIAKCSGVARQDVYRIISELQERGLIEKIVAKPSKFLAVPLQDVRKSLLQKKAEEYMEVEEKTRILLKEFDRKQSEQTLDYSLTVVPSKGVVRRIEQKIGNSQYCIEVIASLRRLMQAIELYLAIKGALERGVTFRVVTQKPENGSFSKNLRELQLFPNFNIKYLIDMPEVNIAIYDKRDALVAFEQKDLNASACFYTNSKSLLTIFQDFFENIWKRV